MMRNNIFNTIMIFSVTAMVALSSSPSMANTDVNNISVNPLSWNQLPPAIQNYYQIDSKKNKLKLNAKDIVAIRSWISTEGDQYLVQLQRFNSTNSADEPAGEVFTHLYTIDAQEALRVWQIYDYVACDGLDVIAEFAKNTAVVTDINNNGAVEVSVPYYLGCRGGVSYDEMKVIMYEGQQKFAVRGNSAICNAKTGQPVDTTGSYGGDYKVDEKLLQQSTLSAPQKSVFRRHLKSVWRDNQCSIYFKYDD
ncbi:M949_RS01915 family surface polysaccharide biosynthesis protein [Psychrobacter sp. AOP22-C1-22]|uniref:M949_RS01915 family surface polysaccharide biosynthesis protein n=2 Tax=unclassified Psychrobacter TaxID=196806 RepID=UPI00178898D2|nr:hypothetical protein [Psychrobacter sp. FME6]MBE0407241.1 hypothetical protein [Psychrobacter sp. FME6]